MTAQRCTCSPRCRLRAAQGEPYALRHDPRPEKQQERSALMASMGARGAAAQGEQRERLRRRACSLRTVADLLGELEKALLLVDGSAADKSNKAMAIVKIISEARAILNADLERQADRLTKLLDANPELARRLQLVKP